MCDNMLKSIAHWCVGVRGALMSYATGAYQANICSTVCQSIVRALVPLSTIAPLVRAYVSIRDVSPRLNGVTAGRAYFHETSAPLFVCMIYCSIIGFWRDIISSSRNERCKLAFVNPSR